ncbi:MAG TPA: ABC transporter substrate-binding protein [Chloroflexota bacterium]
MHEGSTRTSRLAALALTACLTVACASASRPAAPAASAPAPAAASASAAAPAPTTAPAPASEPPPRPLGHLKTAYTTVNASLAPVWLAVESGAFAEQGLDAELSFVGPGPPILGSLTSQETPIVAAGGNQMIDAALQGGDYVLLGAASSRVPIAVLVVPALREPADLRGKTLGVSSFGAISHVGLRVALAHWGFEEGHDVYVVRSGGTAETIAAMQNGAIDGGAFGPPQSFGAREMGFRELIDVATLNYEIPSNAIVSTRGYVAQQPAIAEAYLKAIMRGIQVYRTNKELAVDAIVRYGRMEDRALAEQTWAYYRDHFRDDLSITTAQVENVLKTLAEDHPAARDARPEQFTDQSFVERIKASGYIERIKSAP